MLFQLWIWLRVLLMQHVHCKASIHVIVQTKHRATSVASCTTRYCIFSWLSSAHQGCIQSSNRVIFYKLEKPLCKICKRRYPNIAGPRQTTGTSVLPHIIYARHMLTFHTITGLFHHPDSITHQPRYNHYILYTSKLKCRECSV